MTTREAERKIREAGADTERELLVEAITRSDQPYRSLVELTADAVFCYKQDPPISTCLPVEEQVSRMYEAVLVDCNAPFRQSAGRPADGEHDATVQPSNASLGLIVIVKALSSDCGFCNSSKLAAAM